MIKFSPDLAKRSRLLGRKTGGVSLEAGRLRGWDRKLEVSSKERSWSTDSEFWDARRGLARVGWTFNRTLQPLLGRLTIWMHARSDACRLFQLAKEGRAPRTLSRRWSSWR